MFLGKISEGRHTRPWNKNRHTKPCKFYQTMSCPLSADVCDFAHVLVDPTPPIRIDAACRYYQAGFCPNGPWCRYAHALEASPALSGAMNGMRIYSRDGPKRGSSSNAGPPQYVPTDRGVISMHTSVAGTVLGPPPTPVNLASPPPSNSFPTLLHRSATMASPDLTDDVYAFTEDPQMSEHSHLHQSRIHIADPSSLVHVPPYSNPLPIGPISPQYQFAPQLYMLEPKFFRFPPPPRKHKPRGISKKKLERYKTKPCKFFYNTGMCPNGDSCTFIHDEDPQSIKRVSLSKNKEVVDDGGSNSSDASSDFAKLSLLTRDQQDFCRVGALTITREDESLSHDSSNSSDNGSSESDSPASKKKKTKRRTRANSIPSRPTASGQLNMDNLFPAESPAVL